MGILNLLKAKKSINDVDEYKKLLKTDLSAVNKEINQLCENFNIQKSQLSDLSSIGGELFEKAQKNYDSFIKEHIKDIDTVFKKKLKIEKALKSIRENNPDKINVFAEIDQINKMNREYNEGKISKSEFWQFLKSKHGKVRFADVLLYRGNKLLILQRAGDEGEHTDKWCIPGGHVEVDEDFRTAAARELYEETGIDLSADSLIEAAVYTTDDIEIHYFIGYISIEAPTTILVDSEEEIGSAWIDPMTEIDDYDFIFDMKENIKKILGMDTRIDDYSIVELAKAVSEGLLDIDVLKDAKEKLEKAKNKHYFSVSERKELADKGEAMPDGKYPIRNKQDLKDAIRLSGSSDKSKTEVRMWIKKRAKELGLEEELPENWKDESKEIEKTIGTESIQVLSKESLDSKEKGPQGSGVGSDMEKGFGLNIVFNDLEEAQILKSLVEEMNNEGKINIISIEEKGFMKSENTECKEIFKKYLNFIEGMKTRLKNVHWKEEDNAVHVYLDDLTNDVSEFEDKLAEAGQSEFGRFQDGDIQGESIEESNPIRLCEMIFDKTKEFRSELEEREDYEGEISWIDDFLATLKQTKYRLQLR